MCLTCIIFTSCQLTFSQDTREFAGSMFWIFTSAEMSILALAVLGCLGGFVQVQKLSHGASDLGNKNEPYDLDQLLSNVTVVGAYLYAVFSMIAAAVSAVGDTKSLFVLLQNALLLIQVN